MHRRPFVLRVVPLLVVGLFAGACTGPPPDRAEPGTTAAPARPPGSGGTLRIAGAALDDVDPARAYSTTSWFLARGVFRTLVAPAPATREDPRPALIGDLATDTGAPNADATRWTFTLRSEASFGPAVGNRTIPGVTGEPITCDDVKYGLERLFRPELEAAYEFYYEPLVGADAYRSGVADEVAGISCPDPQTIVFELDRSVPDWPHRLVLPAATPVPRRVADALDASSDDSYADSAVATGPYAVQSVTAEEIRLVRNEHWDASGDPIRAGSIDRVRWRTDLDSGSAIRRVLDGRLDLLIGIEPRGPALAEVVQDRAASRRLIHEPSGCIRAIYLDTTRPPFDRPIVRRAVALALDRYTLKRMIGGPAAGSVATSVVPPGIPGHLPSDEFDPFPSPHGTGDVPAARRILERAGFSDWDRPIALVGDGGSPGRDILGSVRTDLARLGFTDLRTRTVRSERVMELYRAEPPRAHVGTSIAWCKDVDDASTILRPLFYGDGNGDGTGDTTFNLPRLDDDELNALIDEADATPAGPDRARAWEAAGRRATQLAAWIPWSWGSVTILHGERLDGANYLSFLSHIDWPNTTLAP